MYIFKLLFRCVRENQQRELLAISLLSIVKGINQIMIFKIKNSKYDNYLHDTLKNPKNKLRISFFSVTLEFDYKAYFYLQ